MFFIYIYKSSLPFSFILLLYTLKVVILLHVSFFVLQLSYFREKTRKRIWEFLYQLVVFRSGFGNSLHTKKSISPKIDFVSMNPLYSVMGTVRVERFSQHGETNLKTVRSILWHGFTRTRSVLLGRLSSKEHRWLRSDWSYGPCDREFFWFRQNPLVQFPPSLRLLTYHL